MITTKAHCKECKFSFKESGPEDDGSFVDRVQNVAQLHADDHKHEVEFIRHEHSPKIVTPRAYPPGPGLRADTHSLNPLNDSFV